MHPSFLAVSNLCTTRTASKLRCGRFGICALFLVLAALQVSETAANYHRYQHPPRCYSTGARCAGAPGMWYVHFCSCCDSRARCIADRKGRWGRFCKIVSKGSGHFAFRKKPNQQWGGGKQSSSSGSPGRGRVVRHSFHDWFRGGINYNRWFFADAYANGQPFLVGWSKRNHQLWNGALQLILKRDRFKDPGSASGGGRHFDYTSGEIRSINYYSSGCYSACMKPSGVSGVSSSFYAHAGKYDKPVGYDHISVHNEIDVEFVGGRRRGLQTNYFSRWKDPNANSGSGHEVFHELDFDTTQNFNLYTFRWNKRGIDWYVNGKHIRKVRANHGVPNPMVSPLRIVANVWAVDASRTNSWAGPLDRRVYRTTADYKWIKFQAGEYCQIPRGC